MERLEPQERPKVPKAWHDAVRKLPGNEFSTTKFGTYAEIDESTGLMYSFLSLTADDPVTGLPEGLYINTSMPHSFRINYTTFILPIMTRLRNIVKEENPEPDIRNVTSDIDPDLAELGAQVNLSMTMGVKVAAITPKGALVFAVEPITMTDLRGAWHSSI